MARTKIVATIGPASNNLETLKELLLAGMDVARVNFSHGDRESATKLVALLRQAAQETGKVLAILGDLQGPKLRIGHVPNGKLDTKIGDEIVLTSDESDTEAIMFPHGEIFSAIEPGARLVMGDGEVELTVSRVEGARLYCVISVEGELGSRKGVNMPGTFLPIPSISEKDRRDLETAADLKMDYVALSFVRSADDILELRSRLDDLGSTMPIIAKIEKAEAIDCLEEIRDVADGMMVARGDLGIDLPPYEIPFLQKKIIRSCNEVGKPVITATQMLQSMVEHPVPTRAESTDVANAILDGTDAVMLSAETAAGKYPVASVEMMENIARITEDHFPYDEWNLRRREQTILNTGGTTEAISSASCHIARLVEAKAIVTTTVSGYTARQVARYRPIHPVVALSPKEETARLLNLVWGVRTIQVEEFSSTDELVESTSANIARSGDFAIGERIVITAGVPFGRTGETNLLHVHDLNEEDFDFD